MYELLQQCRTKLATEASQRTVHLRILVGHANMIDVLLEGVEAHEAYQNWLAIKEGGKRKKRPLAVRTRKNAKQSLVRSCNSDVGVDGGGICFDRQGVGGGVVQHVEFSVSCLEVEPDD